MAGLISGAETFGHANGVADRHLLGFALTAYRTGPGAALAAYAPRGSAADTATSQYAAEVLGRLPSIQRWLDARLGGAQRRHLEPGASGQEVVELKRLLREWYASQGQSPPRRMRGPVYGTAAVEAVKEFQSANGLTADGIVSGETWRALMNQQGEKSSVA